MIMIYCSNALKVHFKVINHNILDEKTTLVYDWGGNTSPLNSKVFLYLDIIGDPLFQNSLEYFNVLGLPNLRGKTIVT